MDKRRVVKEVLSWVKTLVIAFVLAFTINNTLVANAWVISSSMENTIMTESRVMGSRVAYVLREPQRFDIILFQPPDNDASIPYVKRIIGLPHERVKIINGHVYINDSGVPLDEFFVRGDFWGNFGPFYVPADSYFVLGDNRNNSHDSRHWINSFVPRDNIIGKLYFEFFPTPRLLGKR